MEFNEKLLLLRKDRGLTQEQLSEKLHISRAAVSKWESGRGFPNLGALINLSRLFEVPVDELLSGDELISLSERDNRLRLNKLMTLIFGLIDLFTGSLIFLPLYGKQSGDYIRLVNLLEYTSKDYILITFFTVLALHVLYGLAELVIQFSENTRVHRIAQNVSMGLLSWSIIVFIATREPYANTLLFLLLLVKTILLIRKNQIK